MKCGTAPPFTTALVCSGVPEAMLVRALTNKRRVLRLLTNQRPVPGGLELEAREVEVLEELHEPRQDAEVDHLVDGRVPLSRQELPDDRNENTAIQTF